MLKGLFSCTATNQITIALTITVPNTIAAHPAHFPITDCLVVRRGGLSTVFGDDAASTRARSEI